MSVKDFYNAVTPGSSLGHGAGRGVYTLIDKKEICSQKMWDEENLPTQTRHEKSVLNEVILCKQKDIDLFRSIIIIIPVINNTFSTETYKYLDSKRGIVDL